MSYFRASSSNLAFADVYKRQERDSLLAAVSKQIEYYDDEELDKYIGTAPDAYTPEQEDEFRDVFYTCLLYTSVLHVLFLQGAHQLGIGQETDRYN